VFAALQDALIVNYILQGEYLQGEYYACAVSGQGLPGAVRGATPPAAGCAMAALSTSVQARGDRCCLLAVRHWG